MIIQNLGLFLQKGFEAGLSGIGHMNDSIKCIFTLKHKEHITLWMVSLQPPPR